MSSRDPTKFIACVHCGASILSARFKPIPVSAEHALTIVCESCFAQLPVAILVNPTLPDYLRDSENDLPAYRASLLFMKGHTTIAPEYFLQYMRGNRNGSSFHFHEQH